MTPPSSSHSGRGFLAFFERRASALTITNLVAQIGIIATGGVVRLSESGLGCSTAPQCEPESFLPSSIDSHTVIEFGNRIVGALIVAIAASLAIAIWRSRPDLRWWATLPLAGSVFQAALGAASVRLDLDPRIVGLHMLTSVALVWVSTYVLLRHRGIGGSALSSPVHVLRWVALAVFVPLISLGILTTGAGPHSGDAEVTERLNLDLEAVTRWHAAIVWLFVAVTAVIAITLWRRRHRDAENRARRAVTILVTAIGFQGLVGYVQYFNDLPEVLVGIHGLGVGVLTAAFAAMFVIAGRPSTST